jgi:hypothetical protein
MGQAETVGFALASIDISQGRRGDLLFRKAVQGIARRCQG